MKMLRILMLVLVVLTMMAFACKAKVEVDATADSTVVVEASPVAIWTAELKTVVETWEKKAGEGKITNADFDVYAAAKADLMKKAETLDLEANATDELKDLMARMDKLDQETIPKAMK